MVGAAYAPVRVRSHRGNDKVSEVDTQEQSPDSDGAEGSSTATAEGAAASGASPETGAGGSAGADASTEANELDRLTTERDQLKDQLLRTAAELDNFRKRTKRDLADAEHRGRETVLREILPVIDNLERAVAAAATAAEVSTVVEGVRLVLKSFQDVGNNLGLQRMAGVGERFDPALHDAIQQIESDEHPPGTVVAEIVPGYRLRDKLLRAAMVVVSKLKPAPVPPAEGDAASGETTS